MKKMRFLLAAFLIAGLGIAFNPSTGTLTMSAQEVKAQEIAPGGGSSRINCWFNSNCKQGNRNTCTGLNGC